MNKNNGITILSLVITVIVLLILAGVSIQAGSNIIKKSELENIKTNMLLVKVKGKERLEKANFYLGTKIEEIGDEDRATRIEKAKTELIGEDITDSISSYNEITTSEDDNSEYIFYYKLTNQNLSDLGLSNVKSDEENGWYILRYDIKNIKIEVYNTKGFENEEETYYTLNEIQNVNV